MIKPAIIAKFPLISFLPKQVFEFIFCAALLFLAAFIFQVNFIAPLFLLILVAYLKISRAAQRLKNYSFLNLGLLFVVIFALSYFISSQGWPVFYIPFSFIPLLAALLFAELEIPLLLSLASSVTAASLSGNNYLAAILFLTGGILSSLLVFQARKRSAVIRAGLITGLAQAVCLFFFNLLSPRWLPGYLILTFNGIASSILALGVLPVFEYLFKTTTNISLLELADFNHPLLQRLIQEAPGTYHHSLIVGNLSEAASRAVGAHALLARIGAYYHDIGKLSKPEYFSENMKEAKHDTLSPTMSKMIIMNHVKEGVELAQRYKLNPGIIEFIQEHHGNSLVYYFYRRALEGLEEDHEVKEEGFRYPGPKPRTKETAIVLLADSAEAATRALKDPAPARIEEMVHKIINNKFIDGQLDECDLTLKDLEKISSVFIRILSGIYHSRAAYP